MNLATNPFREDHGGGPGRVPDVEDERAAVRVEAERVHLRGSTRGVAQGLENRRLANSV